MPNRYYCDAPYCDRGIYYPDSCKANRYGAYPPCAVLLAEYPGTKLFKQ